MVSWGYLPEVSLWRWTSQIPLKGPCCIPLLTRPNPAHFPPADSLHSHVESSFPYQADTGLPRALLPATRRWERGAGSSFSLFRFAKPCHRHRLTPKTRWRQPREKAFRNASTRLPERWCETRLNTRRGLRGSVPLLFPRASFPPACPLRQGKHSWLGKSKQMAFS